MAKLSEILIGLIVASVFILAIGLHAEQARDVYNVNVTQGFNSTYERFERLQNFTSDLQNRTASTEVETETFFNALTSRFFKVLLLFFQLPLIVADVVTATFSSGEFALGGAFWIPATILLLLTIVIIVKVVGAILRGDV